MSRVSPFRRMAALAGPAVAAAAVVLLTPSSLSLARAEAAQPIQQAAVSGLAKSDNAKPAASPTTGMGTAFSTSVYGPYGAVGWLVGGDSMSDMDTLQNFLTTDADFATMVTEAGPLFIEGSGVNGLIERIH